MNEYIKIPTSVQIWIWRWTWIFQPYPTYDRVPILLCETTDPIFPTAESSNCFYINYMIFPERKKRKRLLNFGIQKKLILQDSLLLTLRGTTNHGPLFLPLWTCWSCWTFLTGPSRGRGGTPTYLVWEGGESTVPIPGGGMSTVLGPGEKWFSSFWSRESHPLMAYRELTHPPPPSVNRRIDTTESITLACTLVLRT